MNIGGGNGWNVKPAWGENKHLGNALSLAAALSETVHNHALKPTKITLKC